MSALDSRLPDFDVCTAARLYVCVCSDRDSSATVIVRSPLASTDNSERAAVLNGSSASSDLSVPIAVADTPPVLQPNKSLGSVVAGDGSSARITDVDDLTSPNAADGASSPQSPDSEAVQAALAAVKAGRPLTPVAAVSLMGRASVPTDPWSQSLHGMRAVMYAFLTSSAGTIRLPPPPAVGRSAHCIIMLCGGRSVDQYIG